MSIFSCIMGLNACHLDGGSRRVQGCILGASNIYERHWRGEIFFPSERTWLLSPDLQYELISIYGHNIIGTEGAEWKRHRDVARSAFNEVGVFSW